MVNFKKLALTALAALATTTTFAPQAQAANRVWLSDADTCHQELLRTGQNSNHAKCGRYTRVEFTYNCRKPTAQGPVNARCNSKDLSDGQYNAMIVSWHNHEAHALRVENKKQRAADLAAGRVIVPGVPVTVSMNPQQRAVDRKAVWWYHATPQQRAEYSAARRREYEQMRCRDIYGSGLNTITVDWCTLEVW